MRMLRSLAVCAIMAMASVIAVMPASAAIPLDPGIHDAATLKLDYPAPIIVDTDRATLTCDAPTLAVSLSMRRPGLTTSSRVLAMTSESGSRVQFVQLRRRC